MVGWNELETIQCGIRKHGRINKNTKFFATPDPYKMNRTYKRRKGREKKGGGRGRKMSRRDSVIYYVHQVHNFHLKSIQGNSKLYGQTFGGC
jgi:hypothetical protein